MKGFDLVDGDEGSELSRDVGSSFRVGGCLVRKGRRWIRRDDLWPMNRNVEKS